MAGLIIGSLFAAALLVGGLAVTVLNLTSGRYEPEDR